MRSVPMVRSDETTQMNDDQSRNPQSEVPRGSGIQRKGPEETAAQGNPAPGHSTQKSSTQKKSYQGDKTEGKNKWKSISNTAAQNDGQGGVVRAGSQSTRSVTRRECLDTIANTDIPHRGPLHGQYHIVHHGGVRRQQSQPTRSTQDPSKPDTRCRHGGGDQASDGARHRSMPSGRVQRQQSVCAGNLSERRGQPAHRIPMPNIDPMVQHREQVQQQVEPVPTTRVEYTEDLISFDEPGESQPSFRRSPIESQQHAQEQEISGDPAARRPRRRIPVMDGRPMPPTGPQLPAADVPIPGPVSPPHPMAYQANANEGSSSQAPPPTGYSDPPRNPEEALRRGMVLGVTTLQAICPCNLNGHPCMGPHTCRYAHGIICTTHPDVSLLRWPHHANLFTSSTHPSIHFVP